MAVRRAYCRNNITTDVSCRLSKVYDGVMILKNR